MAIKLRKELGCPLIKSSWEKRDSPKAFEGRNDNAIHADFGWSKTGATKAQKFKDKGAVVLSGRGLRVLVPYSGLLLPDEVDLRELAENIALANPDVLDTSTMDAVLKRIVKDIWYDSLPSIKRRRNKERLEIEAAPNGTRSVSSPSQVEPNGLKPLPMLLTRCPNLPKMNLTA